MDELESLARSCREVTELTNVSPEASTDCADELTALRLGGGGASSASSHDRHFSPSVCAFLKRFRKLQSFQGRLSFTCFASFLRLRGQVLTRAHLTTSLVQAGDLLLLRLFAPNLEVLEGKFLLAPAAAAAGAVGGDSHAAETPAQRSHAQLHRRDEFGEELSEQLSLLSQLNPFSEELPALLSRHPWQRLRAVDVEGRLSVLAMQILAGAADQLEVTACDAAKTL